MVQVLPETQAVAPAQPIPPHCPHFCDTAVGVAAAVVVVVVVVLVEEITVVVEVVLVVVVEVGVETGVVVFVVLVDDGWTEPLPMLVVREPDSM